MAPADPIKPADIRLAAMDLLARREHSQAQLRRKLLRRFADHQAVECELARLAEENLQSDQRFAESFVRQRSGRGYGPLRVEQELREKGLSDAELSAALDDAGIDWCTLAAEVFRKKFGAPEAQDIKQKARCARFMHYRGFSHEHFQHLLQN